MPARITVHRDEATTPAREDAHSQAHQKHGANGHGSHVARFRRLFWISLALSVPVVLLSPIFAHLLGYPLPAVPGLRFVSPVLGTVIFAYAGQPFLTGAWSELRSRRPGMMLLIAMAITVAFAASWASTIGIATPKLDFWWELALLVTIMLLGHWLEMRSLGAATGALDDLAALLPDQAERVTASGVEAVAITDLHPGEVVLVRSGGRVPADGQVIEGAAELDESMITGESRPVTRTVGDRVVGGTVATDSAIRVQVTAVGADTALAGIQRLVTEAQSSHSRAQALADRAAGLLFYFAAGSGLITLLVWALIGRPGSAVERAVTVLVIACPHALGLAIPLVIAISTELSARQGILIKDRLALERMRTVDVVLFDKTGTLTRGEHVVTGAAPAGDLRGGRSELLRLAGAAESDSEHPVARAIVRAAEQSGDLPPAAGFRSLTGRGVEALVGGLRIAVGGPALLRELRVEVPADVGRHTDEWAARGAAVLHVLREGKVIGALALEDEIRPESRQAVQTLHEQGVRVAMITGDARSVAEAVGGELGVDDVLAEVLPRDKDGEVAKLQARGMRVAMVGDGVNDAPALARADVGIAIGAGTDVAIESAGVVLASNDPRAVLGVRTLSQATYRKMWQNLVWAAGYNLVAVPLAAGALAWAGIVLPMEVGAILMSLSTIIVALNAQLLRRLDLRPAVLAAER
ncbi:MAG: heavy metal translocating P-type ATPase [Candidatus Dormibacteraceae bacterium]